MELHQNQLTDRQTDTRPQRALTAQWQWASHAAANEVLTCHNCRCSCWRVLTEIFMHWFSGVTRKICPCSTVVVKSKDLITCPCYSLHWKSVPLTAVHAQPFIAATAPLLSTEHHVPVLCGSLKCSTSDEIYKWMHHRMTGTDEMVICTVFLFSLNRFIVLYNYTGCPFHRLPEHGSITA